MNSHKRRYVWLGIVLALPHGCAFAPSLPVHYAMQRRVPLSPQLTLILGADPGSTLQLDLAAGTLNLGPVTLAGTVGIEWRW